MCDGMVMSGIRIVRCARPGGGAVEVEGGGGVCAGVRVAERGRGCVGGGEAECRAGGGVGWCVADVGWGSGADGCCFEVSRGETRRWRIGWWIHC